MVIQVSTNKINLLQFVLPGSKIIVILDSCVTVIAVTENRSVKSVLYQVLSTRRVTFDRFQRYCFLLLPQSDETRNRPTRPKHSHFHQVLQLARHNAVHYMHSNLTSSMQQMYTNRVLQTTRCLRSDEIETEFLAMQCKMVHIHLVWLDTFSPCYR